jgi:hypothetical protein
LHASILTEIYRLIVQLVKKIMCFYKTGVD